MKTAIEDTRERQLSEPFPEQPTKPEIRADALAPSTSLVVGMQKWAGEITAIDEGLLTLQLFPLNHEGPAITADFDVKLLGPDLGLAKPGGVVYLTTRLVQGESGYIEAMTNLRLRRPRRWSAKELKEAKMRSRVRAAAIMKHAK